MARECDIRDRFDNPAEMDYEAGQGKLIEACIIFLQESDRKKPQHFTVREMLGLLK